MLNSVLVLLMSIISEYKRNMIKGRKNMAYSKNAIILAVVIVLAVIVIATVMVLPNVYGSTPTTSSTNTTTTSTTTSTTSTSPSYNEMFFYQTMPQKFNVDGYTFFMVYNGTAYGSVVNGTMTVNLGFSLVFDVSNGSVNETIVFGWASQPLPNEVPVPNYASLFNGKVTLKWFSNSTGLYMQILAY